MEIVAMSKSCLESRTLLYGIPYQIEVENKNMICYKKIFQRYRLLIMAILLCISFIGNGCGPSKKDNKAKIDSERIENTRKAQEKENKQITEIEERFNAIYFPPQNITSKSFSYEIQKYFEVHSRKHIVFKGYLQDIEANNDIIIAEFICPIGNNYIMDKTSICFRLSVPYNKLDELLKSKRHDAFLRSLRFLYGPDYIVVSNIIKTQRMHKYESRGTVNGEDVEIETDDSNSVVAVGQLIGAVNIPRKEISGK